MVVIEAKAFDFPKVLWCLKMIKESKQVPFASLCLSLFTLKWTKSLQAAKIVPQLHLLFSALLP